MGRYKYFTDEETSGMTDEICQKLDRARDLFGFPIILTCGYRSPEHNTEIGGVPDSEHIYGRAADIQAPQDPFARCKLAWACGLAGFQRLEICQRHFHVDISPTKTSPDVWEGEDK